MSILWLFELLCGTTCLALRLPAWLRGSAFSPASRNASSGAGKSQCVGSPRNESPPLETEAAGCRDMIKIMSEIALYKALVEAGASEEAAREAVHDLPRDGENVTKADLAAVKAEMKADLTAVEIRLTRWVVVSGGIYTAILFSLLKLL